MSGSDRFVYHGNASIVSGHLLEPRDIDLNLGGSALPLAGGRSCHRVKGQRFGEVLAFAHAETHAHGAPHDHPEADGLPPAPDDAPAEAVVGVDLRGLTIGTRPAFSAKRIGAVLTADCACDSKEPSMGTLDDARFDEVAVDGHRLSVAINRAFFKTHDTLTKLAAVTGGDPPGLRRRSPLLMVPRQPQIESGAPMLTTIVKSLRWLKQPFPGAAIDGHVLTIPGLGRIFFGEMFVTSSTRRLTMLRLELTGAIVFDGALCEVEAGGHWRR